MPEELWMAVRNIVQEAVIKTMLKKKKCKKAKWLSEEGLQIDERRRKAKCKVKNGKIKCISGNTFENKIIMIEQQSAYSPFLDDEYFIITSIKSNTPITCIKGNVTFPTEAEIIEHISTKIKLIEYLHMI